MTNGEKLKQLRAAYKLSQQRFGKMLSITKSSINAYEWDRNPINENVKCRIFEATGIGADYFDTDMTLQQAFEKYGVNPDCPKFRASIDCMVYVYASIEDFIGKVRPVVQERMENIGFLKFITDYKKANYYFVKVKNSDGCLIADEGDILVVVDDEEPAVGDWVIVSYKGKMLILQYLIVSKNEIGFKSSICELSFYETEPKKDFEILGVIKSKISNIARIAENLK